MAKRQEKISMSDKHEIQSGHVIIPGAIANKDDYQSAAVLGAKLIINPPPSDGNCNICGKNVDELEPFGGAGDPLVGDFTGMKLVKSFREELPDYIGSSWECRDCIGKYGGLWELEEEKKLVRELSDGERKKMRDDIEASMEEFAEKDRNEFYEDIMRYVHGEPNGIRGGTVGKSKADLAKRLTTKNPKLLLLQNRGQLLDAIDY
jgi:hypothetical protein